MAFVGVFATVREALMRLIEEEKDSSCMRLYGNTAKIGQLFTHFMD